MDLDTYSRATGLIYDAAIDPTRWREALHTVGTVFNGHAVSLIARNVHTRRGHAVTTVDAETEREFWSRWQHTPLAPRADAPPAAPIETDQDMLPKAELLRSAYYNEFLRPRDMHAGLMFWLPRQGAVQPTLSVMRRQTAGEYERADVEIAHRLRPHLQRAVAMADRLRQTALADVGAVPVLDLLPYAVVILDANGGPLHLNRSAERLLADRDGVFLYEGRLRAATPSLSARLDAILARAAGMGPGPAASGGMALPRAGGGPALVLLAVPLRRDIDWLGPVRPGVCVCIADPAAAPRIPPAQLAAFFRLTRAEAAIASELLDGREVADIAERLRLSPHTVRAHVARIMGKTDTRRQAQLVRRLMTIPPFRD